MGAASLLAERRAAIRAAWLADETEAVRAMLRGFARDAGADARVAERTGELVRHLREDARAGLMETFLAQYGLSTQEGVALMCLAEALLRVPDPGTIDDLIRDKLAPGDWGKHLGQSSSPLVNASTWALMLTGQVIRPESGGEWDVPALLHRVVRRGGEPLVRAAVAQAIRILGRQFVLGRDIDEAMDNATEAEARGYTYSYDMLGEAARTAADAQRYFLSYSRAIGAIAGRAPHADLRANPGISVKLSALHPRYEQPQRARAMDELVPRVQALALLARNANIGFNVDAEEQDRLDLSLDVIEATLASPALRGWGGFGIVVQAYAKRAGPVIAWIAALAESLDRRVMVRLVKGAYWDSEIKNAQIQGLAGFPVWTRKAATDLNYLARARELLDAPRIYPQFATHNAQTAAAILQLAGGRDDFEFQRLHGMGEALHERLRAEEGRRCRIYAPVGVHKDLLAYLVRRLLENGANSSFVHQVLDRAQPPARLSVHPADALAALAAIPHPAVRLPPLLYAPARRNSRGWSLAEPGEIAALEAAMAPFRAARWHAGGEGVKRAVRNPADARDEVGTVADATREAASAAVAAAVASGWGATPLAERAATLDRIADSYEANAPELMALATREAGKTRVDAVSEIREAVDFCRYYAAEARRTLGSARPRGAFACISPWNFPLAIFTGQAVAALVAGDAVLAKPAEQAPLIAARAVALMHGAGVPADALHFLPGEGGTIGAALVADPRIAGVCMTGSTDTARLIERAMAAHLAPDAPLIAETGGINAMVVDSTALPEQVVRDVISSAFQSAGQRCSALRLLCLQEEIAAPVLEMLQGAMDELALGDPWDLATDVGPVIDADSRDAIEAYVAEAQRAGRVLKRLALPPACAHGTFVAPTLIRVDRVADVEREVFGPVLHVATFASGALGAVVAEVNAQGFGLTMGLHSRVDARVAEVVAAARVGNLYVNRNQIGAVVGVQPFGGEGLSGTGPKAGGPHYLARFASGALEDAAAALELPGPAGESNRLTLHPRGAILLVAGERAPADEVAALERRIAAAGNTLLRGADPATARVDAVAHAGDAASRRALRRTLAARDGTILPLLTIADPPSRFAVERTVSVDTTASGGNVALLTAGEA